MQTIHCSSRENLFPLLLTPLLHLTCGADASDDKDLTVSSDQANAWLFLYTHLGHYGRRMLNNAWSTQVKEEIKKQKDNDISGHKLFLHHLRISKAIKILDLTNHRKLLFYSINLLLASSREPSADQSTRDKGEKMDQYQSSFWKWLLIVLNKMDENVRLVKLTDLDKLNCWNLIILWELMIIVYSPSYQNKST